MDTKTLQPVPRRRGRPPALVQKTNLSSWVDVQTYDDLIKLANQRDQSVSSLVRQFVVIQLHSHK